MPQTHLLNIDTSPTRQAITQGRSLVAGGIFLFLASSSLIFAQTPSLDRLNEALAYEKKSELRSAQDTYESLLTDPTWGTAAHLGLARVLRWQYQHNTALIHYETVIAHPLATQGMRDEAHLGIAQIDAANMRLAIALQRLGKIDEKSAVFSQARQLQEQIFAQHPTRISVSYGQVRSKSGPVDDSLRLAISHQLDLRQSISLSHASNSLVQRSTQPNIALDFVKSQTQAIWRYQVPLDVAYRAQATIRQLSLGGSEASLRWDGSWPLRTAWRANASAEVLRSSAAVYTNTYANGSLGLSTKIHKNWQLGATLYSAETAEGHTNSWMANATYESGPLLAQWFMSRTVSTPQIVQTLVLRQRMDAGPTWRTELKHDANGNTWMVGLDIPWGKHMSSASVQASPFAKQWSAGFEYAWPNGFESNSPSASKPPLR
jgi:tetratricopeptide (TPR) repeat protein